MTKVSVWTNAKIHAMNKQMDELNRQLAEVDHMINNGVESPEMTTKRLELLQRIDKTNYTLVVLSTGIDDYTHPDPA